MDGRRVLPVLHFAGDGERRLAGLEALDDCREDVGGRVLVVLLRAVRQEEAGSGLGREPQPFRIAPDLAHDLEVDALQREPAHGLRERRGVVLVSLGEGDRVDADAVLEADLFDFGRAIQARQPFFQGLPSAASSAQSAGGDLDLVRLIGNRGGDRKGRQRQSGQSHHGSSFVPVHSTDFSSPVPLLLQAEPTG